MKRLGVCLAGALLFSGAAAHSKGELSPSVELNNQAIQKGQAGNLEEAVSLLRQALALDPSDPMIRKNLSLALTGLATQFHQQHRIPEERDTLEEAVKLTGDNGLAWVALGNLSYLESNDFDSAIRYWKKAHNLIPSQQWQSVADRLAQAERDQKAERRFATEQTQHFQIRFPPEEAREAIRQFGERLEKEYSALSQEWESAPGTFTAILYGGREFQGVKFRQDWAIGFYDGRIRLRLQDVGSDQERWIIRHELAHAFLHHLYGQALPTWIHEGYARTREEGRQQTVPEQEIAQAVAARTLWIPLVWIESRFEQPSDFSDVERAYAVAHRTVDFLIRKHGLARLRAFLKALASGKPVEEAFDEDFPGSHWGQVNQGILE